MQNDSSQKPESSLTEEIAKLRIIFEERTCLKYKFLSGICTGVGSVIGASFIATLVLLSLNMLFRYFHIQLPNIESTAPATLNSEVHKN
jgi:hypothetical protein